MCNRMYNIFNQRAMSRMNDKSIEKSIGADNGCTPSIGVPPINKVNSAGKDTKKKTYTVRKSNPPPEYDQESIQENSPATMSIEEGEKFKNATSEYYVPPEAINHPLVKKITPEFKISFTSSGEKIKERLIPEGEVNEVRRMVALTAINTAKLHNLDICFVLKNMAYIKGELCMMVKLMIACFADYRVKELERGRLLGEIDVQHSRGKVDKNGKKLNNDWYATASYKSKIIKVLDLGNGKKKVVSLKSEPKFICRESHYNKNGTGAWKDNAQIMLSYRAIANLLRTSCPDSFGGFILPEEAEDIPYQVEQDTPKKGDEII